MSVEIKVGETKHAIEVTWKVASALAEKFADPIDVTNDIMAQTAAQQAGEDYSPKYPFNMMNSVRVCGIALRASGLDVSDDEIGDQVMGSGEGLIELVESAVSIFVNIIDADGVEVAGEPGKKKKARTGKA